MNSSAKPFGIRLKPTYDKTVDPPVFDNEWTWNDFPALDGNAGVVHYFYRHGDPILTGTATLKICDAAGGATYDVWNCHIERRVTGTHRGGAQTASGDSSSLQLSFVMRTKVSKKESLMKTTSFMRSALAPPSVKSPNYPTFSFTTTKAFDEYK